MKPRRRIYVAARFSDRIRLRPVASKLRKAGHAVTSSWLGQRRPTPEAHRDRVTIARRDLHDVRSADLVLVVLDRPENHGGRATELGYALGRGIEVWSIANTQ